MLWIGGEGAWRKNGARNDGQNDGQNDDEPNDGDASRYATGLGEPLKRMKAGQAPARAQVQRGSEYALSRTAKNRGEPFQATDPNLFQEVANRIPGRILSGK
jgi:hypothetical protein